MNNIKDPNEIDLKKFLSHEYSELPYNENNRKKGIISIALYVLAFFVILVLLVQLVLLGIYKVSNPYYFTMMNNPVFSDIYSSIVNNNVSSWTNFLVYFIMAVVLIILNKDVIINDFKRLSKVSTGEFFTVLLIGYGFCTITSVAATVFITLFNITEESANESGINSLMDSGLLNFFLMATPTILFAPIVEELTFRKSMFNVFRRKFNVVACIIISSVLFGSIHVVDAIIEAIVNLDLVTLKNEFIYLIAYSIMGLGFGCAYQVGKQNIVYTIILHSINNFTASLILFFLLK